VSDEAKPKKTFIVCQQCGTLFRIEVEKIALQKGCVKCGGALAPLKGDVPHDQVATVLFLKPDETGPQVGRMEAAKKEGTRKLKKPGDGGDPAATK